MRKLFYFFLLTVTCLQAHGRTLKSSEVTDKDANQKDTTTTISNMKVKITVGEKTLTATLSDNVTAKAFIEKLPLVIKMTELNGNEKYGNLAEKLPGKAVKPGTIHAGDLMLWDADYKCLVLFYRTFRSPYSYVKIGTIDDISKLEPVLGSGNVEVKFERLEEK